MANDSEKLINSKKHSKGSSAKPSSKTFILVASVVSLALITTTVGIYVLSTNTPPPPPPPSTTEAPPRRRQEPLSGGPLDESVELQDFQDKLAAVVNEGHLLSGETFEEDVSFANFEIPSTKHSQEDELDGDEDERSFESLSMEEHFEDSIEGETDDITKNSVVDKDIEKTTKEATVKKQSIREEDPIWDPAAEEEIEEKLIEKSTTLLTAEKTESTSNADVLIVVDTADVPQSAQTIVTPLTDESIMTKEGNKEPLKETVDETITKETISTPIISEILTESTEEITVTDIPEETLEVVDVVSQELVDIDPEIDLLSNEVEQEHIISEETDVLNDVSEEDKGTTESEEPPSEEEADARYSRKEEL